MAEVAVRKAVYAQILSVIMALAAGFAILGESRDYRQYQLFFESLRYGASDTRFEPGFVLLSKAIVSLLNPSFNSFLLVCAWIALSLKMHLLATKRNLWIPAALYVLVLLPLHEMTQIRLALAVALAYWAVDVSIRHNHEKWVAVPSLLILALGASFQSSVLVMLPFSLGLRRLFHLNDNLLLIMFFVIPAGILWLMMGGLTNFNPLVSMYWENTDEVIPANPFSVRNLGLITLVFVGYLYLHRLPEDARIYFYISVMGIGLWYGMMTFPVFAHRLLELTIFSYFLWIPALPTNARILCWSIFGAVAGFIVYRAIFLDPMFS